MISNFSAKTFRINSDSSQPHEQSSTQSIPSSSFKKTLKKYVYKGAPNNRKAPIPPARQSLDVVDIIDNPPRGKRSSTGEKFLGFIDLTHD
jgi:hypothetical protein